MVIGKIKPTATIVAQFAAGVEVEAIQHEGKMFFPVVGMGEFAVKDTVPEKSPSPVADAPAAADVPAQSPKAKSKGKVQESDEEDSSRTYTEEELMGIDTKELLKICKNEFNINPDDYEGKNTNKKLRGLILDAQEDAQEDAQGGLVYDDDEEPSKDKESSASSDLAGQVAELLEDFDAGKKNKKKTLSLICDLVDDADEDSVSDLIEKFEDDADADIDEIAKEIADVLEGNSSKKKSSKPSKQKKSKKEEEELVDVSDLEVGDRVSVWWDDDNQEWYDGEVKSIKKGKVIIAYDDDTEDAIDPEVHTKIKKLAE